MPRNWRTTLFLATQDGSLPEAVMYSPLRGKKIESLSLDNTPSDLVWYTSPGSLQENTSDTRLTLMKIRQMQNREKERTREVMEEESLANTLAAINIDSHPNHAQGSAAPVDSLTNGPARARNVQKPETPSRLGDSIPNTIAERRSSQARRSRNYHPYQYRQPSTQSEGGPSCAMEN